MIVDACMVAVANCGDGLLTCPSLCFKAKSWSTGANGVIDSFLGGGAVSGKSYCRRRLSSCSLGEVRRDVLSLSFLCISVRSDAMIAVVVLLDIRLSCRNA